MRRTLRSNKNDKNENRDCSRSQPMKVVVRVIQETKIKAPIREARGKYLVCKDYHPTNHFIDQDLDGRH